MIMEPEIFIVRLKNPVSDREFEYLLSEIRDVKKKRILKQRIKTNADSMLVGEVLAMCAVKKVFGIPISEQKFSEGENGKPFLSSYPGVYFNISHSGDYVVCAVADRPVGVDIQKISEFKYGVVKRVCNEEEVRQIEECEDKNAEFIKLWTQKEAVLKMNGTGISGGDIKNCLCGRKIESVYYNGYYISVAIL